MGETEIPKYPEINSLMANPSVEIMVFGPQQKDVKYNSMHFFSIFSEASWKRLSKFMANREQDVRGFGDNSDQLHDDVNVNEFKYDNMSVESATPKTPTVLGGTPPKRDDWAQIAQGEKTDPLIMLRMRVVFHANANVKIRIGDVQFHCHFVVLQCYSSFFWRMDPHTSYVELNEQEISAQGFMMTYDWMLSDQPIIRRSGVSDMLQASYYLGIPGLEVQCWRCLDNDVCVRECVAFQLYLDSFRCYNFKTFRDLFLSRVCKYFLALVADDLFMELSLTEVCTLLSSSSIGVNTEGEVLMAALRWIHHDFEDRSCFSDVLISCVRFKLMASAYLSYLVLEDFCPTTAAALSSRSMHAELAKATTFTSNMELSIFKTHKFIKFVNSFKVLPPRERQWIIDKNCPYHHRLLCASNSELDFTTFQNYMQVLKKRPADYWMSFQFATLDENGSCFNASCIEAGNTRIHTALIANRQLSVAYLRHLTGDPHIKFTPSAKEVLKCAHEQQIDTKLCCQLAREKLIRMPDMSAKLLETVESLGSAVPKECEETDEFEESEELNQSKESTSSKKSVEFARWQFPKMAIVNNIVPYTVNTTDVPNQLHLISVEEDAANRAKLAAQHKGHSKSRHKSRHSRSHKDADSLQNGHDKKSKHTKTPHDHERAGGQEMSVQTELTDDGDLMQDSNVDGVCYEEDTANALPQGAESVQALQHNDNDNARHKHRSHREHKSKHANPQMVEEMSVQTEFPWDGACAVEGNGDGQCTEQENASALNEQPQAIEDGAAETVEVVKKKRHKRRSSQQSKHYKNRYKNLVVPKYADLIKEVFGKKDEEAESSETAQPENDPVSEDKEYARMVPVDNGQQPQGKETSMQTDTPPAKSVQTSKSDERRSMNLSRTQSAKQIGDTKR